jgi:hypothetical protein
MAGRSALELARLALAAALSRSVPQLGTGGAFSARRGLDAPDRHPARERLAGVSRAGGERLLTGWDISAAGLAQSQPLVASSPLSPVVARAEMSTCSQLRGRGRTSQLLHRYRG